MRSRRRYSAPALYLLTLVIFAGCTSTSAPQPAAVTSASAEAQWGTFADVRIGSLDADENFSSATTEQWLKEADYVAVVRIVSEQDLPPAKSEIERGEGLIMRLVTARVEQVVWSHPQVSMKLPSSFDFNALGWAFKDGLNSKYRIGFADRPYLLPDHNYLMAIRYVEFGCPGRLDPQDGPPVKVWSPLGSQAIVPFDGSLGVGEFEGKKTESAGSKDASQTFRKAMLGKSVDWVAQSLSSAAEKNPKLGHTPGPFDCEGE